MSGFLRTSRSLIGIDVGTDRLKAVQVVRSRQSCRIAAGVSIARLENTAIPSEEETRRLMGVLENTGFSGREVVLGAPRSLLNTAVLDLPPKTSGAPVEQICAAELARMFRLTPGAYELHAWEMPSASERSATTQMTASALACEKASDLVAPFEACGFRVEAIDLASAATSRAYQNGKIEIGELTTLLDIGWSGMELIVFRGGQVVYERWLQGAGLAELVENLTRSLHISDRSARILIRRVGLAEFAEAQVDPVFLARVLSMMREFAEGALQQVFGSVAYVLDRFPGESVTHMCMLGGGATMPQLPEYLAEMSGLDVRVIVPRDCGFVGGRVAAEPQMLTALGHAMWGAV